MVPPPLLDGADHDNPTRSRPTVVTNERGALARPGNVGVKDTVADAPLWPMEFTAKTRNTYCWKLVRLFTVTDVVVETPSSNVVHDDPFDVEYSTM